VSFWGFFFLRTYRVFWLDDPRLREPALVRPTRGLATLLKKEKRKRKKKKEKRKKKKEKEKEKKMRMKAL
jgi:hypothetical protein